jgi:hypothetical protein
MITKLAVLADYANSTNDGKLNVMGIFSRIRSANFPARHSQCHLVISCETNDMDLGKTFPYSVKLQDPDGKKLMGMEGTVTVRGQSGSHDVNLILRLNDLVFPEPGNYQFLIDIGDSRGVAIVFIVDEVPEPNQ